MKEFDKCRSARPEPGAYDPCAQKCLRTYKLPTIVLVLMGSFLTTACGVSEVDEKLKAFATGANEREYFPLSRVIENSSDFTNVCVITPYMSRVYPYKSAPIPVYQQVVVEKINNYLEKEKFDGPEGYSSLLFLKENGDVVQVKVKYMIAPVSLDFENKLKSLSGNTIQRCAVFDKAAFARFADPKGKIYLGLIETEANYSKGK